MRSDVQHHDLAPARVEWVPSSPERIEVRVFGTWREATVPPPAVLAVGEVRAPALPEPPDHAPPPAWSAAFHVPAEARAAVEAGEASLEVAGAVLALPAAVPGRMGGLPEERAGGTLVDPAVLAERRARRAEVAERSAAARAATAEQTVQTLRAQLENLEERQATAAAERERLAGRVADAERRLRLAEQREEAERRRRSELEEEAAHRRRAAEEELADLRARLAGAEEVAELLERELRRARRRQEALERQAGEERAARTRAEAALEQAVARARELERAAGSEVDDLRRRADDLRRRLADVEREREALAAEHLPAAEAEELRGREAAARAEARALGERLAAVERDLEEAHAARAQADELRARLTQVERELHAERAARAAAERAAQDARTAADAASRAWREAGPTEREAALEAQIAALEAELRRRTEVQVRVQQTIDAVRDELAELREQVDAARSGEPALRAQLDGAEAARRRAEEALHAREAELSAALADLEHARAAVAAARTDADEQRRRLVDGERLAAELEEQLREERGLRVAAQRAARAALEDQLRELTEEVAGMRERLQAATVDLERRLADERARREAAEARLAATRREAGAPAQGSPGTGGDALDALIAGLRQQVASARRQLETWDVREAEDERGARPPEPAPGTAAVRDRAAGDEAGPEAVGGGAPSDLASEDPAASRPAADREGPAGARPGPAAGIEAEPAGQGASQAASEVAPRGGRVSGIPGPPQPEQEPRPGPHRSRAPGQDASAEPGPELGPGSEFEVGHGSAIDPGPEPQPAPEGPALAVPVDERTRRRLAAIEADLRASIPRPGAPVPARDVIASLQTAAERLRAAAEAEGEGLDTSSPGDERRPEAAFDAAAARLAASRAAPERAPLRARAVLSPARERGWLRTAVERLAAEDPEWAAELVVALLPAQALLGETLTYTLSAPALGTVTVDLTPGKVTVERGPAAGRPAARLSGSLPALAPLATGGAGWRLWGVRVEGARRGVRRLVRARRRPVTLADLAVVAPSPPAATLLAALSAAVDPAWTAGHRFGVSYDVDGEDRWTVVVQDGSPLRVEPDGVADHAATVELSAGALLAVLAGAAPAPGEHASVAGDARAAGVLHGWFDRARGVDAS